VSLTADLPQTAAPHARDPLRAVRGDFPDLPVSTVVRHRLNRGLTAARGAAITFVQAPSGAGKTTGVAAWAGAIPADEPVIWISVDSRPHCLHPFWSRLRSSLIDTGVGPLPIAPLPGTDPEWSAWISILAGRLTQHGRRCLVVLDDFPVGPSCQLGDQVTQLASQAEHCLHLIIISSASPAIDVDKLQADRACTRLDPELLAMSDREVAAALSATGVHHVHPEAVSAVRAHTFGWARGVMLAARMMSASIDEQQPNLDRQALVPPLADLDRALDALIERDVLATLPPATRELVIRTSVADQVPADLARAVLDEDQPSGTAVVDRNRGFVDQTADGSLRCHPLLRRAALRRLGPLPARVGRTRRMVGFAPHPNGRAGRCLP